MLANRKVKELALLFAVMGLPAATALAGIKISMADARRSALAAENGQIKSAELEKEKGKKIYSFDIQMPDGLHEVNVDAVTGKVLQDSIENAQDEAKEQAADAARKTAKRVKKIPAPNLK